MKFELFTATGSELAYVVLEKNYGNHYFIQQRCPSEVWDQIPASGWIGLLEQALTEARRHEVDSIAFRLVEAGETAKVGEYLEQSRFTRMQERYEYRTELSLLPKEDGTPMSWHPLPDLSDVTLQETAQFLLACAEGDPNFDLTVDAFSELKADLGDSVLTGTAECIHIGHFQNRPVACVFAQINPSTGWSRITYMGVLPEFRGKGLGKWIHRHGMEMLRAQGGKVYHGGTTAQNLPMRQLFEKNACQYFRKLEEWKWKNERLV